MMDKLAKEPTGTVATGMSAHKNRNNVPTETGINNSDTEEG